MSMMKILDDQIPQSYILTADIGGSHITTAICNANNFSVEESSMTRIAVDSNASSMDIMSKWTSALHLAVKKSSFIVTGVGIAMPGPFDYQNGISYIRGLHKFESIYGMDIKSAFVDSLGLNGSDIRFRNDAESIVAGEAVAGAGYGHTKVAGVTLGTGFGSAYCACGISRDLNYCSFPYKESIADDYFSSRWFQKRYLELTGEHIANVKELIAKMPNDANIGCLFDEFSFNMADFLRQHLYELSPDVLVLCGNITKAYRYFLPQLRKHLPDLNIQVAMLGETASLIGAAALFTDSNVT